MNKEIRKALHSWLDAGIIDQDAVMRITQFESVRTSRRGDHLKLIVGIMGGILVALGFTLLAAYNWDALTPAQQTLSTLLLQLAALVFAGGVLLRGSKSRLLREVSASVLFIITGASLMIISDIYEMQGDGQTLLVLWALLGLPVLYVMRSHTTSILLLALLFSLAWNLVFAEAAGIHRMGFLLLFVLYIPFYALLCINKPYSHITRIHHWMVAVLAMSGLPLMFNYSPNLNLAYLALGGLLLLIGLRGDADPAKGLRNAYVFLGLSCLGMTLYMVSLESGWNQVDLSKVLLLPDLAALLVLVLGAAYLSIGKLSHSGHKDHELGSCRGWLVFLFVVMVPSGVLALYSESGAFLYSNGVLLAFSLLLIYDGATRLAFGFLNLGLIFLAAQILTRFFAADWSMWLRGIAFIVVGLLFIATNVYLIQKREPAAEPRFRFGEDIR